MFEVAQPLKHEHTKEANLEKIRNENMMMADKIIENLVSVTKLRNGPNELVISGPFIDEHSKIIQRLESISGLDQSFIEVLILQKAEKELNLKIKAEEETKEDEGISIIDSLLM